MLLNSQMTVTPWHVVNEMTILVESGEIWRDVVNDLLVGMGKDIRSTVITHTFYSETQMVSELGVILTGDNAYHYYFNPPGKRITLYSLELMTW